MDNYGEDLIENHIHCWRVINSANFSRVHEQSFSEKKKQMIDAIENVLLVLLLSLSLVRFGDHITRIGRKWSVLKVTTVQVVQSDTHIFITWNSKEKTEK